MSKVTSKQLATLAGRLLQMTDAELKRYVERSITIRELRALCASVLCQRESVEKKVEKGVVKAKKARGAK